jgi:hypothetical protein
MLFICRSFYVYVMQDKEEQEERNEDFEAEEVPQLAIENPRVADPSNLFTAPSSFSPEHNDWSPVRVPTLTSSHEGNGIF